ncbi:hypothetical protein L596_017583 [Steinernema carpocapsae]|uniref:Uncharacterized protein n=1 Tax=Steinernema carpocapsae TaxID=34508 RepID=A0A4U5N2E3_STECR|nr:hypothetical protein L596_017583 [Steinernema carpocapsae]
MRSHFFPKPCDSCSRTSENLGKHSKNLLKFKNFACLSRTESDPEPKEPNRKPKEPNRHLWLRSIRPTSSTGTLEEWSKEEEKRSVPEQGAKPGTPGLPERLE